MDMTGERRIAATRERVWEALNDPEILRASIPGCETLVREPDGGLRATASVKIGPISAKFTGRVELLDLDPPNGYRIAGEGQGGVAGFAKGGATVALKPDGHDTLLNYDVKAQVGGKIAQLGARLIDATAKQMSDAFFDRFSAIVAAPAAVVPGPVPTPITSPVPETAESFVAPSLTPGGPPTQPQPQTAAAPMVQTAPAPMVQTAPAPMPVLPPFKPIGLMDLMPREPFGFPLVAWGGGVVYLLILLLIFGSLL